MSLKLSYISCNLRNARSLIAEKSNFQIKNSSKYISRLLNRKKPKIEFNNKLFIKSLLSNLENKKANFFLKHDDIKQRAELNTIKINKRNKENYTIYINNNFQKLRKSRSCIDINEEKNNLIENNIKSNKKFNNIYFDEINKNQDIIITPKINSRKINQTNDILKNLKPKTKNLSFIIIKKAKGYNNNLNKSIQFQNYNININNPRKTMVNSGTDAIMSKNMKINKGIQSSIDIGLRKNRINDDFIRNRDLKTNLSATNIFLKKKEYLKFLEKKSLALRANIIVNNIQENRGGKQELRKSYNPNPLE